MTIRGLHRRLITFHTTGSDLGSHSSQSHPSKYPCHSQHWHWDVWEVRSQKSVLSPEYISMWWRHFNITALTVKYHFCTYDIITCFRSIKIQGWYTDHSLLFWESKHFMNFKAFREVSMYFPMLLLKCTGWNKGTSEIQLPHIIF